MEVIIKPIVTEKMNLQGEGLNKYGFMVAKSANKLQIKKAVENLYGVTVADVNTMVYGGRVSSRFTKTGIMRGRAASFKKAVVTLAEGEKIDFYSNI